MKQRQLYLYGVIAALGLFAAHDRNADAAQLNQKDFVNRVDNKFFPLPPGTTYFYQGEKEGVPTSDEFIVTRQTQRIAGVNCIPVRDRAYENEVLVEDT